MTILNVMTLALSLSDNDERVRCADRVVKPQRFLYYINIASDQHTIKAIAAYTK